MTEHFFPLNNVFLLHQNKERRMDMNINLRLFDRGGTVRRQKGKKEGRRRK
jgi:hypothetical protein